MDHSQCVQSGCRVCGGRLKRYKVSYDCHTAANRVKLQSIGVSIDHDAQTVHPQRFCHGCYNVCSRAINASKAGKDYTPRLTRFEWKEHIEDSCTVCEHFSNKGRKPNKVPVGRPSQHLLDIVSSIKERAPSGLVLDLNLRQQLSQHPSTDKDLLCPLCHLVLDRPLVLTTCNTLICLTCCIQHIYAHTDLSCPCCGSSHSIDKSNIVPASPIILRLHQRSCTAAI